jgi:hypothetical protein
MIGLMWLLGATQPKVEIWKQQQTLAHRTLLNSTKLPTSGSTTQHARKGRLRQEENDHTDNHEFLEFHIAREDGGCDPGEGRQEHSPRS